MKNVYEKAGKRPIIPSSYDTDTIIQLSIGNKKDAAKGKLDRNGVFTLLKGSLINKDHSRLTTNPGVKETKSKLLVEKKSIPDSVYNEFYSLQSDIQLWSPGTAGRLVKGYESNGDVDWINENNIPLGILIATK